MFLSLKSIFLYGGLLYNMWQNGAEGGIFAAGQSEQRRNSFTDVKKI